MKKIVGLILLLVVAVGLYAAAGPYLTLYQLRTGIEDSDPEMISDCVDFPVLRANLKEQLHATVLEGGLSKLKEYPFESLARGLVSKLAGEIVDSYVTPAGLIKLLEGNIPVPERNPAPVSESKAKKRDPFQNARCSYDSVSKFSVRVKDDKDRDIRFILTRNGLSWKLSNIILPLNGK